VAAALAAYGQARAVLDQQLGMDPGEELVTLHRAILNRDPALDAPPGAGFGRQGIAVHAGLPPRQLPADVAGFVGRSSELASLAAALRNALLGSGPAAVVVRGAGGTGKTALAVRAAHQVGTLFPGGQIFIDLGGVTGGHVPDATVRVLRALGVRAADMPDGADERAALFRSLIAGRRVLVVLDDAATAGQIRPLLTSGSGLLVTSRRLLATLDRAAYVDLGPLPAEHGLELLHALAGGGRFAAERAAAAEIVRRCAGLPLALRIVGARLASRPDWPLALMAEELAERPLETLEFEDLSVRAAIDVDYRAVADAPLAAQVLRMLSRLSGAAATTQALAGHLGEPPSAVSRALERLVDCGLAESPRPRLYRLPALVREYAAELAAADNGRGNR
jgi:DNA-binding transcriptional ArsR family regulator